METKKRLGWIQDLSKPKNVSEQFIIYFVEIGENKPTNKNMIAANVFYYEFSPSSKISQMIWNTSESFPDAKAIACYFSVNQSNNKAGREYNMLTCLPLMHAAGEEAISFKDRVGFVEEEDSYEPFGKYKQMDSEIPVREKSNIISSNEIG